MRIAILGFLLVSNSCSSSGGGSGTPDGAVTDEVSVDAKGGGESGDASDSGSASEASVDAHESDRWAYSFPGRGSTVSIDPAGNTYVSGFATGDFGAPVNLGTGTTGGFVAKLDVHGKPLWRRAGGGAVAATATGVLYAGALDSTGPSGLLVGELAGDGSPKWSKSFPTSAVGDVGSQVSNVKIARHDGGRFLVTFTLAGSITIASGHGSSDAGHKFSVVAVFDATGTPVWSRTISSVEDYWFGAAFTHSGQVLAAGTLQSYDYGRTDGLATTGEDSDLFATLFDASGATVFAKSYGNDAYQGLSTLAVDSTDGAALVGWQRTKNADGTYGASSAEVYAIDATGALIARHDVGMIQPWTMTAAGTDYILGGDFSDGADLGVGPLTTKWATESFYAMLGSDGAPKWRRRSALPTAASIRSLRRTVVSRGPAPFGATGRSTARPTPLPLERMRA